MIDKQLLAQHLEYSLWATQQILGAVKSLSTEALQAGRGNSFGGIHDTLLHVYRADRIWHARFTGVPNVAFAQPEDAALTIEVLERQWPQYPQGLADWTRQQSNESLSENLHWINLKGEPKSEKKYKALLHIVNHGTYHRGQVITMLKQAGGQVVSTDLVYYPGM
jgi:uncharacterized damage-inducible protein DinB